MWLGIEVCALVLIGGFLQRYTSVRLLRFKFGPGSVKLVIGVALVGFSMFQREALWLDPVLGVVLIFVSLLVAANLILLGLIDVIGAAIKMIDAAVKKRQA